MRRYVALGQWYRDTLGFPRGEGAVPPRFLWREREAPDAVGISAEPKVVDDFNGRFAWVMDPEGNKIELWEPKTGF